MTNKAYSYIRFSVPKQANGQSLERQDTGAQEYAAKNGLILDTTLNMRDLGISGYSGRNVTDGALGRFLKAIDDGAVPAGSYLLIEDIDRLSRLPVMEALAVFQSIINNGVTVVTLTNGAKYSKESLNNDWSGLLPVLVNMGRAHGESERKSDLLTKVWRKKQERAAELIPMGNNAPLWLKYTKGEGYSLRPERVALVRRIFQLSIEGRGRGAIVKILNGEGLPAFKKDGTWSVTSLNRLLSNRAVLGEYQPRIGKGKERKHAGAAIPGYFPAILDESTFNQAQEASNSRYINRSTKQSKNFNVWQGVAKCVYCHASMHMVSKGVPRNYTYLTCHNSQKGICKAKSVRLDASELVFKEILAKVGNMSLVQASASKLERELQAVRGKLSIEQDKLQALATALDEFASTTVAQAIQKKEQVIAALEQERDTLAASLAADTITDKEDFFAKLDLESYEGRSKANSLLKRLKIWVRIENGKINGAIDRADKETKYIVSENGKIILGIRCSADGSIHSLPFTIDALTRFKVQEMEGNSSDSMAEHILACLMSDAIINKEWPTGERFDEKIKEALEIMGLTISPVSEEFQAIRTIIENLTVSYFDSAPDSLHPQPAHA